MTQLEVGAKVAYMGACFKIGKFLDDGKVLIYPNRRNYTLPNRVTVDKADLVAWAGKQPSVHAKTCQICGRPIYAQTGVIAHHGYERPGHGIQTDSCYGARFQPFEIDRSRLGWYIEEIAKPHLEACQNKRATLETGTAEVPGPDDVTYQKTINSRFYGARKEWRYKVRWIGPNYDQRKYVWPRGYETEAGDRVLSDKPNDPKSYADYLRMAKANADQAVEYAARHLKDQQKRFDKWKPAK